MFIRNIVGLDMASAQAHIAEIIQAGNLKAYQNDIYQEDHQLPD